MAQLLRRHLPVILSLILFLSKATADANFTVSRAAYYPNSDIKGTESKYLSDKITSIGLAYLT